MCVPHGQVCGEQPVALPWRSGAEPPHCVRRCQLQAAQHLFQHHNDASVTAKARARSAELLCKQMRGLSEVQGARSKPCVRRRCCSCSDRRASACVLGASSEGSASAVTLVLPPTGASLSSTPVSTAAVVSCSHHVWCMQCACTEQASLAAITANSKGCLCHSDGSPGVIWPDSSRHRG